MCRVLGCVAHTPVSLRYELLEAPNALARQAEAAGSGFGVAAYLSAGGSEPSCGHFLDPADGLAEAAERRGRIFNVHLRRASIGPCACENTHPFCLGNYSFAHNGTILDFARLREPGVATPHGATDSELWFQFLMRDFDPDRVLDCLRHAVAAVIDRSQFTALNFLFSDGERLYAYRLGAFELHWRSERGRLLVASQGLDDGWHSVQQDVVLVLDPDDPDEPHAERLVGDAVLERAHMQPLAATGAPDPAAAPLAASAGE
jgi:predicted glutamine amidotransferase